MSNSQSQNLKIFMLLLFFICIYSGSYAGKLEKAFEALHQYNFASAKVGFDKSMKKKPAAASYGLSLLYGTDNNPFFNPDSAYKYIIQADTLFDKLDEKEKEKLAEIPVNDSAISAHKVAVSHFFFQRIENSANVDEYITFIEKHPWAEELNSAIENRNELAFELAKDTNTYLAYNHFMNMYPDAEQKKDAKKKYDELFFKTMTKASTVESYQKFIVEHPESPYLNHAESMVYELSTAGGSEADYANFILSNPNNHMINEAWKRLYRLRIKDGSAEQISEFLLDYGSYPFKDEAMKDFKLSNTIFYAAKKDGKWGFVDSLGNWLVEPIYDWVEPYKEGKSMVSLNDKIGFVNFRGEQVVSLKYSDAFSFHQGTAVVEGEDGYGLINFLGDTLIPLKYDELGIVSNGLVYAGNDDLYGYYNVNGDLVIPFQYDLAFDFEYGLAKVKKNGLYGLINQAGAEVIPFVFDKIFLDSDSLLIGDRDGLYGLITWNKDTLVPFEKDYIGKFSDDLALCITGDEYSYINKKGELVFESKYDLDANTVNYADFKNGYAHYKYKGKFGIIDTLGNRVFPAIFEEVGAYDARFTPVKKRGKWGYANGQVDLVIPYKFNFAWSFADSLAKVEMDGLQGIIDVEGNYIVETIYNSIEKVQDQPIFIVDKDRKFGLIKNDGLPVLPLLFDQVKPLDSNTMFVELAGLMGIYNRSKQQYVYVEVGFTEALSQASTTQTTISE